MPKPKYAAGRGLASYFGSEDKAQICDVFFAETCIAETEDELEFRGGSNTHQHDLPDGFRCDFPPLKDGYRPGRKPCGITIDLEKAPQDIADVYLRLTLLSQTKVLPNTVNLDGIFGLLPMMAWTNYGPLLPDNINKARAYAWSQNDHLVVRSVDKFPPMADYVIPPGVRIANTANVRLGAYLGEGTTVMHAGFVNFNSGTIGPAMVEGRISAGITLDAHSDLGGGASTMGTLSGGNDTVVSLGKRCLIGANAGINIPLGDDCIVEAGLYLTAGQRVQVLDDKGAIVKTCKAIELQNQNQLLFIRNSETGAVQCRPNHKAVQLNDELHQND